MGGLRLPNPAYKNAHAASKPCNDSCSISIGFSNQEAVSVKGAYRNFLTVSLLALSIATVGRQLWAAPQTPAPAANPDQNWIARSNGYTELLLDVTKKHSPEAASAEGLAQFDEQISQPTKQDEDAAIAETR